MGIKGVFGRGGSGKSLCKIAELWKMYKQGRDIVSNSPLIDLRVYRDERGNWRPLDKELFGESWASGYIRTFSDIYELDNCEVLMDEIGAWLPAHKHQQIPDEVRNFLAQDRREGVNVHWTHRTTKVFHEVLSNTAWITRCYRYGGWVFTLSWDPEEKGMKKERGFMVVNPNIYSLYQTYYRIGPPDDKALTTSRRGYGLGKRSGYGGKELTTMVQRFHNFDMEFYLSPEQKAVWAWKYGPGSLGWARSYSFGRATWSKPTADASKALVPVDRGEVVKWWEHPGYICLDSDDIAVEKRRYKYVGTDEYPAIESVPPVPRILPKFPKLVHAAKG